MHPTLRTYVLHFVPPARTRRRALPGRSDAPLAPPLHRGGPQTRLASARIPPLTCTDTVPGGFSQQHTKGDTQPSAPGVTRVCEAVCRCGQVALPGVDTVAVTAAGTPRAGRCPGAPAPGRGGSHRSHPTAPRQRARTVTAAGRRPTLGRRRRRSRSGSPGPAWRARHRGGTAPCSPPSATAGRHTTGTAARPGPAGTSGLRAPPRPRTRSDQLPQSRLADAGPPRSPPPGRWLVDRARPSPLVLGTRAHPHLPSELGRRARGRRPSRYSRSASTAGGVG